MLNLNKHKIIVCWYGSFYKNGTIGDLLAVQTLTNFLSDYYNIDYISYKTFNNIKGTKVDYNNIKNNKYTIFIFCCGPIIKIHKNFTDLINKFKNSHKIGISISLFDEHHFNYTNPFDYVLAREGTEIQYEDIAIIAPRNKFLINNNINIDTLNIGICLRGFQSEYGNNNCLNLLVDKVIDDAFKILKSQSIKFNIININNHLETSNLSPYEIENKFRCCNLIITTRFHGCILSLRNNVPFIAIDQIKNGGKLQNLINKKEYPYIFNIMDINSVILSENINIILNNKDNKYITQYKSIKENNAIHTLNTLKIYLDKL